MTTEQLPSRDDVPEILDRDADEFDNFWYSEQRAEPLLDLLLSVVLIDPQEFPATSRMCFLLAVHDLVHRFRMEASRFDENDPYCDWYVETSHKLSDAMTAVWVNMPERDKQLVRDTFEKATALRKNAVMAARNLSGCAA